MDCIVILTTHVPQISCTCSTCRHYFSWNCIGQPTILEILHSHLFKLIMLQVQSIIIIIILPTWIVHCGAVCLEHLYFRLGGRHQTDVAALEPGHSPRQHQRMVLGVVCYKRGRSLVVLEGEGSCVVVTARVALRLQPMTPVPLNEGRQAVGTDSADRLCLLLSNSTYNHT